MKNVPIKSNIYLSSIYCLHPPMALKVSEFNYLMINKTFLPICSSDVMILISVAAEEPLMCASSINFKFGKLKPILLIYQQ